MLELDAPTVAMRQPVASTTTPDVHAVDEPPRIAGIPKRQLKIGGGMLAVFVVFGTVGTLTGMPGFSTPAAAPTAEPTAYQQGYSYGQRLDNQGYGDGAAYSACRGEKSQQVKYPQDVEVFQMACDIGYAQ